MANYVKLKQSFHYDQAIEKLHKAERNFLNYASFLRLKPEIDFSTESKNNICSYMGGAISYIRRDRSHTLSISEQRYIQSVSANNFLDR